MKKILVTLLFATVVQSASAAPYVRFLLPLYIPNPVAGAYGSVWQSQFAVHNSSAIRSYIIEWCPFEGCTADLVSDEELVPNETETALPRRYPAPANGIAGAVLYLFPEPASGDQPGTPPDNASSVTFQLRITDLNRAAIAAGTEIPVIRENAFRTATTQLLNVPTDARFRTTLRIFEMNRDRADFDVRVVDQSTNAVLSESRVSTTAPAQPALRLAPGFAEINGVTMSTPAATSNVRIEIEPLTAGAAFWTYVSITNNESQQITLVTPQ